MKYLGLILFVVIVIILFFVGKRFFDSQIFLQAPAAKDTDSIIVYNINNQRQETLTPESPNFQKVLPTVESMLNSVDSGYKFIPGEKLIESFRYKKAIEVVYTTPKPFKNNKITVSSFIIPFEGEFAQSQATVFYKQTSDNNYRAGIFTKGKSQLQTLESLISTD